MDALEATLDDWTDSKADSAPSVADQPAPRPFGYTTLMLIEVPLITLTGLVASFGVASNLVSLAVFLRQGILSHSSVVTLSALTVSDGCSCFLSVLVLLPTYLRYFADYYGWRWDVDYFEVYVTIRPTHMFTQITCLATAYLTLERVLSVLLPFKAKSIFTPKRSLIGMVCLFLTIFVLHVPNNYQAAPSWVKDEEFNVTFAPWRVLISDQLYTAYFYASPVVLRFSSIAVVIVCNCILWWKVNRSQKFRKGVTRHVQEKKKSELATQNAATRPSNSVREENSTSKIDARYHSKNESEVSHSPSDDALSKTVPDSNAQSFSSSSTTTSTATKDVYLLRMIIVISSVFTVCYTVNVVSVVVFSLVLTPGMDYHFYVDFIAWDVVSFFQTINGSINIFIYYNMSQRFRQELNVCCRLNKH